MTLEPAGRFCSRSVAAANRCNRPSSSGHATRVALDEIPGRGLRADRSPRPARRTGRYGHPAVCWATSTKLARTRCSANRLLRSTEPGSNARTGGIPPAVVRRLQSVGRRLVLTQGCRSLNCSYCRSRPTNQRQLPRKEAANGSPTRSASHRSEFNIRMVLETDDTFLADPSGRLRSPGAGLARLMPARALTARFAGGRKRRSPTHVKMKHRPPAAVAEVRICAVCG